MRRKNPWKWIAVLLIGLPLVLSGLIMLTILFKQDEVIQSQIEAINDLHNGLVKISDTHLDPFKNFPYASIKIDNVRVYESKAPNAAIILDVADIFIGFNLLDLIQGNFDIQSLLIEDGFINIILHEDMSTNFQNAFTKSEDFETDGEPVDIHLRNFELKNVDIHKLDEATMIDVETYFYWGKGGFKTEGDIIAAHIDSEFELNIISNGDTSYIKHKHFEFHTDVSFYLESGMLTIKPSSLTMEHGNFEIEGTVDTKNEMSLDLKIQGTKPNFDMLIAFAPHDLVPVLERYRNAGKIYFNATLEGPTVRGKMPFINAEFGASEAHWENKNVGKRVDNMGFEGHFTNGEMRDLETMEFSLYEMTANLEKGSFLGEIFVKNFKEPEIDMKVNADFNLEFLAEFLNLTEIESVSGKVAIEMNFHDIIDIENPEHALNELNQAYFMELTIEDLAIEAGVLPVSIDQLNSHVIMNGHVANLDLFELQMGQSDVSINGFVSDLPALLHHTDIPVEVHLEISADAIDIAELTNFSEKDSTGFDERIEDLRVGFSFKSSARAFTESEYLPVGEFFVDSLHAQLNHYSHELHDFHVDLLIEDRDLEIIDFTGYVDDSDFHLNGKAHDYGFWMQHELDGDVDIDLTYNSRLLRLVDIFSYKGENYVPKEYQHEEFDNLVVHANTRMHYKEHVLHSIDIDLDKFEAKMHLHPMRFENFNSKIHYEDKHIMVDNFHGKMGRTVFDVDMNYYLGEDQSIKERDNHLHLDANYVDFDQLFDFRLGNETADAHASIGSLEDSEEHSKAFNLYELPFTDMEIDVDIDHFIYKHIDLQHINSHLRTTKNHYVYIDTLHMNAAGGFIDLSGQFNGSDPEHIYFSPNLKLQNVDIDKLLFKFESFGEDIALSENLHGILTTTITGKIRVYPDFVPDLDQSEIHMDVQVVNGRLVNYEPIHLLADYMGDKDLDNVRFDTLANHMDFTGGTISIPNMRLESTLGHFEISGTQDLENLEYYVRVPLSIIKDASKYKLFGDKSADELSEDEDEIIEVDPNKNIKYLNLKIYGNLDDIQFGLGKDKTR